MFVVVCSWGIHRRSGHTWHWRGDNSLSPLLTNSRARLLDRWLGGGRLPPHSSVGHGSRLLLLLLAEDSGGYGRRPLPGMDDGGWLNNCSRIRGHRSHRNGSLAMCADGQHVALNGAEGNDVRCGVGSLAHSLELLWIRVVQQGDLSFEEAGRSLGRSRTAPRVREADGRGRDRVGWRQI